MFLIITIACIFSLIGPLNSQKLESFIGSVTQTQISKFKCLTAPVHSSQNKLINIHHNSNNQQINTKNIYLPGKYLGYKSFS